MAVLTGTKWYLKDCRVYIGGYDLSGVHNEVAMQLSRRTLDQTTFVDDTQLSKLGLRSVKLTGRGFWDAGSARPETAPAVAPGGAGIPNGTYRCSYTFVTALGESMPSAETVVVVVNNSIAWSAISVGPAGTIARRLYRTAPGGGVGTGRRVTEIADNVTTIYADNATDAAVAGGAAAPVRNTSGLIARVDDLLYADMNLENVPVTVVPSIGQGAGGVAYAVEAANANYSPVLGAHGELVGFDYEVIATAAKVVRGTILHTGNIAGNGNGVAKQLGAVAAAERLYGVIHAYGFSGTDPTLDLTIASDDAAGFPSSIDRLIFAQEATYGSEWKELAGPVTDDWYRVVKTIGGGGGPSVDAIVLAAHQ